MSVDNVKDPEVRNVLQKLLNGQERIQSCVDGITSDVTELKTNVTDIKERTSKIEHALTHFVK